MALLGGGRRKKQALSAAVASSPCNSAQALWFARSPVKVLGHGRQMASAESWTRSYVLLGPGQFCGSWLLMVWGADGWLPFYSVCGNLWIPVMAMAGLLRGSFCYEFGAFFLFIAELAGQWQALLLVSFGFGGLAVGQCHTSYGSFGLVSCWVRVRLGQCPARLDSFDLRARAHERGGVRSELWISPMLRLYVQEGGPFLGLCTGWRPHFAAICIV